MEDRDWRRLDEVLTRARLRAFASALAANGSRRVRVFYRGRPWDWHVFRPLQGSGYRAFWFGPFKIVVRN